MNDRDPGLLEDMASYAADAVELLGAADADALASDKLRRYAVVHALLIVGEAASKVSPETRGELADLPWRQAIGLRNVLVHDYSGLDLAIIVKVVREDLPPLIARLQDVLGETFK